MKVMASVRKICRNCKVIKEKSRENYLQGPTAQTKTRIKSEARKTYGTHSWY